VIIPDAEAVREALHMPVSQAVARALEQAERSRKSRGSEPIVLDDASTAGAPAVGAVNRILLAALQARASDIHLEDSANGLRVRHRIDGILHDVEAPHVKMRGALLARLRVMAGMNLAENRLPQDGRMRVKHGEREVDVRVSTVPVLNGESMALRVLDPTRERLALDEIGLEPDHLDSLGELLARPTGMLLATGPGGSGKSTTLHAILRKVSTGREKIFTVEDPVEFDVDGICQVPVNQKVGLTFATLLRSILRQDPDVLLVGEIRDDETADIAVHAALTGHLVLSTLHTADAVSALHRIHDLGVPDYLVAHTVEAVLAQRLVRRVCPSCAEEVEPTPAELAALPGAEELDTIVRGRGCEACRDTGYLERTGIYELLRMSEPLREAFLARRSAAELRELAVSEGMRSLRQDGIAKIRRGVTTPDEVARVS
jgi:type II secretory ATPase GspE/PulE/Tfp pilus assembly ATPase PilB-like protein